MVSGACAPARVRRSRHVNQWSATRIRHDVDTARTHWVISDLRHDRRRTDSDEGGVAEGIARSEAAELQKRTAPKMRAFRAERAETNPGHGSSVAHRPSLHLSDSRRTSAATASLANPIVVRRQSARSRCRLVGGMPVRQRRQAYVGRRECGSSTPETVMAPPLPLRPGQTAPGASGCWFGRPAPRLVLASRIPWAPVGST